MFPSREAVFGFHRRENHEDPDGQEAEYEFAEQNRLGVPTLGISSRVANKRLFHEQAGKKPDSESSDQQNSPALMIRTSTFMGLQKMKDLEERVEDEDEPEFMEFQMGVLSPACSTILGLLRRKDHEKREGEAVERMLWDPQHNGHLCFPSTIVLGFQRWNHSKQAQNQVKVDSMLADEEDLMVVSGPANITDFSSRRKKNRKQDHEGSVMAMEMPGHALPEDLVEKIISMMPFPSILNARFLNKAWHSNFSTSPKSSVFQNQVTAVASKWKHYCPIILNIEEVWLMGYDREYNLWQKMPIGFEREGLSHWFSTQKLRGAGTLMCGVYSRNKIFITNILTRTWKWLPCRPNMEYPNEIHLLPVGSDAYQVLVVTKLQKRTGQICCQLYDSRTMAWTCQQSSVNTALLHSSSVYLNGILYVMEYDLDDYHDIMKLLAYNVKDGTCTSILHPFGCMLHEIETYELLVCQSHVMVVLRLHLTCRITDRSFNTFRNTLMVYRLHPVSFEIREVSRGPPEPSTASSTLFASDQDCIYFGNPQIQSSSFIELNVATREWRCLPPPSCDGSFKNKWSTFSFQPGLNPFVAV